MLGTERFDPNARIPEAILGDTHQARVRVAELAGWVDETFADGREKALALTKLEEASHWIHSAARDTKENDA